VLGCSSSQDGAPPDDPPVDGSADLRSSLGDLARPDLSPPSCTGKPMVMTGTTSSNTIMSGGKMRTYLLRVPPSYDPTKPTSLVLAFHGLSDKVADFVKYIDIESEADRHNVIMIAPQGLGVIPGWNAGQCCGEPQLFKIDDVGLARDLIDSARRDLCIDDKRIFAMGFSNGGMFVHRLACELAGTIAAVGPVSGGLVSPTCQPAQPISLLHMHGTSDPTVGYHGGGADPFFPDIPMVIATWANRDSCYATPHQTYQNGAVTCIAYDGCAAQTLVSLCTIDKGVHAWPGSSNGTPDIKATPTILDFFAQHGR
jgi:polyhydroxybutyrate depolymerase